MTKADWLSIATMVMDIAMMLVAPVWGAWIMSRLSQPAPKPDAAKIKNRAQTIRDVLIRLWTSIWFAPMVSIVLGILVLKHDFREAGLVTKGFVLKVAFDISSITVGVILFFVIGLLKITKLLSKRIQSIVDCQNKHVEATVLLLEEFDAIKDRKHPQRSSNPLG